jgi:hypothetical protein
MVSLVSSVVLVELGKAVPKKQAFSQMTLTRESVSATVGVRVSNKSISLGNLLEAPDCDITAFVELHYQDWKLEHFLLIPKL